MMTQHPKIEELVRRDGRYAYEAYEFVFAALAHTQERLGRVPDTEGRSPQRDYHVTGPELLDGVRELALREFGMLARTVFRVWGINRTDDVGEIIFNLIESSLMSKRAEDTRADFHNLYDLDKALLESYEIDAREAPEEVA